MKNLITLLCSVLLTFHLHAQHTEKESVLFPQNKYHLTEAANGILDKCLDKIKRQGYDRITIMGHADADGADDFNMTLSERRTEAVMQYFINNGVSRAYITVQSFGEKQPKTNNENEKEKQQNRRVEIILEKGKMDGAETIAENPTQVFSILANRDTILTCAQGTILKIKANSLVTIKSGKPAKGIVELAVKEYYKISDILLANLSTTSNGQLLETAGMLHITAKAKEEALQLKSGATMEIHFPTNQLNDGMKLFSGTWEDEHHINWSTQQIAFTVVDEMPQFSGGKTIITYLQENVEYPPMAREMGIQGVVQVTFVVNDKGEVKEPMITRSVSPELDAAALKAIKNMPKWTPGRQNGENVNVQMTFPITFNLSDNIYRDTTILGTGSFKERFEKAFTDSSFNKAKTESIMYYMMSSNKLEWINLDRFLKLSPLIHYKMQFDQDIESVKIIFDRFNSVMDGIVKNGKSTFSYVPKGEKITIVAIKRIDSKPYLSVKQSTISNNLETDFDFRPVTWEMLKAEMRKLDR